MHRYHVRRLASLGICLSTSCIAVMPKNFVLTSKQILQRLKKSSPSEYRRLFVAAGNRSAEYVGVVLSELSKLSTKVLHVSSYCPYSKKITNAFILL